MRTTATRLTAFISLMIAPLISMAQFHNIPVWETDILFAGDLMQHEEQLKNARGSDGTYSYSYYYKHIKKTVREADIAVANLETPLGKSGFGGYPAFCAPDSFLYAALDAGFDVMLLANNHCFDKGKKGVTHWPYWTPQKLCIAVSTVTRKSAKSVIRCSSTTTTPVSCC